MDGAIEAQEAEVLTQGIHGMETSPELFSRNLPQCSVILALSMPSLSLLRFPTDQAAAAEPGPAQRWCQAAAERGPGHPPAAAGASQTCLRRQSDLW